MQITHFYKSYDIDIQLFLFNPEFYFPLLSLFVYKSHKVSTLTLSVTVRLAVCLSAVQAAGFRLPLRWLF
jgi:hypothetical protein